MSKTIEKSVIEHEATISKMHNVTGMRPPKKVKVEEAKKKKKKTKRPEWVNVISEQIEEEGIQIAKAAELEHSTQIGSRREERQSVSRKKKSSLFILKCVTKIFSLHF